jgi:glycosidase
VWTYNERAQKYYFHTYYPFQPELNLTNAAVREEIIRIMNFWLNKGVDGFRLDSAGLLLERKGTVCIDNHNGLLCELHQAVHSPCPSAILLGETDAEEHMQIYGRGIRRRLTPIFKDDQEQLLLAWSLLFTLPGIPLFVYGVLNPMPGFHVRRPINC